MARRRVLEEEDSILLNHVSGYCRQEVVHMIQDFPPASVTHQAGMRLLELCGVSWPEYLSEHLGTRHE